MLLGNYSVLQKSPLLFLAGSSTSVEPQLRCNFNKSGANRNRFYPSDQTAALDTYAVPTGYYGGNGAWVLPQVSGELSTSTDGAANLNLALAAGVNIAALLEGDGSITSAIAGLVVSAVATVIGTSTLSADTFGIIYGEASLNGAGGISTNISALAWAIAAVVGSSDVEVQQYATGALNANIRGYGDMTPEGIRDAIWNAIATQFSQSGTMGDLIQNISAGGGATPEQIWEYILAGAGKSAQAILEEQNAKGLTVGKFLALK